MYTNAGIGTSIDLNSSRFPARKGIWMTKAKKKKDVTTKKSFWKQLGPGLVSGAADDDPSGIGTYSQAGASLGYGLLWTMWLTFPLMVAIQMVSARIGRVTGHGLAANIGKHISRPLLYVIVTLLFVANAINIGADIAAMGAAARLLLGGPAVAYALGLGALSLLLQVFIPFNSYAPLLKFLALALFAYVATVLFVKVPWGEVAYRSFVPQITLNASTLMMIVAVFGTTISPYLFFWQASHEVEEVNASRVEQPLKKNDAHAEPQLERITIDTLTGMALSNIVAFFIMVTTAAVLHAKGVTDIQTSAQAAQALQPVAGKFAFALFAAGIIGTGMLAVPVLAASSAYAAAETFGWPLGLQRRWPQARGFYAVIGAGMLCGMALVFTPLDPVKALVWSAVINGVIAVPVMATVMHIASTRRAMGKFVIPLPLRFFGWLATAVMAAAVLAMGWSWLH
jgi:NRAMP (natural resistance-associated macrophage protein)-like metal ion transporter